MRYWEGFSSGRKRFLERLGLSRKEAHSDFRWGGANAADMISPVASWEQALQLRIGLGSRLSVVSFFLILALLVIPTLCTVLCTVIFRQLGNIRVCWQLMGCSFVATICPEGASEISLGQSEATPLLFVIFVNYPGGGIGW